MLIGKTRSFSNDNSKILSISIMALALIIVSTIRGDFTSDYIGYAYNYTKYANVGFSRLLTVDEHYETLFALLNWGLNIISKDPLILFFFCSLVVVCPFCLIVYKYSSNWGMSFILLLAVGFYYPSFNVTRQVMAASICACSIFFIEKKCFSKFCIIILIATLFHRLSILFLPFYYILQIKPTLTKNLILLAIIGIFSYAYKLVSLHLIDSLGFDYSLDSDVSGMKSADIKSCIVYLLISAFIVVVGFPRATKTSKIENTNLYNICYNASLIWGGLYFLSMNLQFVIRLSYYFFPFVALALTYVLASFVEKKNKKNCTIMISVLLFIFFYNAYSGSSYNPYYTIFNID